MAKKADENTIDGQIQIDYHWSLGKAGERFFREIRDHKRIMGTRCRRCKRVLVPPRIFCEECFVDDVEWVE
ncbi:MAG: zinc ribbon domain-containing protein, partial [Deltaproteobacteria bacterium]